MQAVLLQELLDEVNMGHHHTAAAVSSETELVHGIAVVEIRIADSSSLKAAACGMRMELEGGYEPISHTGVIRTLLSNKLDIPLPKVGDDLFSLMN